MASEVHCIFVDAAPGAISWTENRIHQLEARWSRFIPSSELSKLNRLPEGRAHVSSDTLTLVESMQLAHGATNGRYDPTMLVEICVAGYDHSIDDQTRPSVFIDLPAIDATVDDVAVDRDRSTVWKPPGVGLDPGGIGKGLAADLVVTQLLAGGGAAGALISIGGDLAMGGCPPPRLSGWHVDVDDPHGRVPLLMRIGLNAGGIATSSTRSRRWNRRGRVHHHILDPRSRAQSGTDLASVTVVASAGWLAEAHATAALVEGGDGAIEYLEARGLAGMAVTDDGEALHTADLDVQAAGLGAMV